MISYCVAIAIVQIIDGKALENYKTLTGFIGEYNQERNL